MYVMGVDIGSASSNVMILGDNQVIVGKVVVPMGTGTSGPIRALEEALKQSGLSFEDISKTVATGYGRLNFKNADKQISEITCHAKGVHYLIPTARTIIDIGGQDAKVIRLSSSGIISNFVMNDKCAAGTGRFLEVMARVLETDVSALAELAACAAHTCTISSTCCVFAESEVISQLSAGNSSQDIAAGVHQSVARRVAGLVSRVGKQEDVVMTGGVAKNQGVVNEMEKILNIQIRVAPDSQLTGALGAALFAWEEANEYASVG
ncbi:MAG: acyl-CoA dehydratase activase [Bacillota bacterium]|nr:acyl-CoA dehydratase activase [Bacillota bacterium]